MKLLLVFALAVGVIECQGSFLPRHGLPPPERPNARARIPVWGTIEQPLDNFNSSIQATWTMRFLENNQFFKEGGPIFIMLGAEWTIDPGWLQTGNMFDMARENNGYMFYTEHRYYGRSIPTSDLSTANLKYLSVDQALADVANFINNIKATRPEFSNSKVVVVGGSYGATMAIWMREKYPNLVHAAVSSSAPVLAEVDFTEYYEIVQNALGLSCSESVRNATRQVLEYLNTPAGVAKVSKDFNLCSPLNIADGWHIYYFFMSIGSSFAGLIQYSSPNTPTQICNIIQDPSLAVEYDRLVKFVKSFNCMDNYQDFIDEFRDTEINYGNMRQWVYQTCTEFGWFQTTGSPNQPFLDTFPVELAHQYCLDIFGDEFTSSVTHNGVDYINKNYGALNPDVSRVVSVHGTWDPWHSIGLTASENPDRPVIVVKGSSHCQDLNSVGIFDLPELAAAKKSVKEYIKYWLALP